MRDSMRAIARLALLCGLALASGRPAFACSCAMRPVCAAFWEADRVFIGRADVTTLGPGSQLTRFRVEESFRGSAGGVVEIVARGIGGSCAYAFVHGTTYLVFARRAPDGTWSSFFCDPITPLAQAGETLAFARGVARDPRRGGRLFGSASILARGPDGQVTSASPLSGATITIRREAHAFSATTDSSGAYELKDVPPGSYSLTVSAVPGVESIPPARIDIKGPGACASHAIMAVKRSAK